MNKTTPLSELLAEAHAVAVRTDAAIMDQRLLKKRLARSIESRPEKVHLKPRLLPSREKIAGDEVISDWKIDENGNLTRTVTNPLP